MRKTITSTEAGRNFGDLLSEVKQAGREIVITRSGTAVARISPVSGPETLSLRDLVGLWANQKHDPDPGFARDLEKVQRADKPGSLQWPS